MNNSLFQNNKIFQIIIEIAWLVVAVMCIVAGTYLLIKLDFSVHKWRIIICYILGIVSIGMSYIRRMQRKNRRR